MHVNYRNSWARIVLTEFQNGASPQQGGNNWPLRGGKASILEGGTRVPTLVWGRMLKQTGRVSNE